MNPGKYQYIIKRAVTGLGFFAAEPIPANKKIIEYVGPLTSNTTVQKKRGKYFFSLNTKWAIDGSPRSNIARYINHSCRPNAQAFISGRHIWIWSKKHIRASEEITINYGQEYFEDYIKPRGCRCIKCAA